MSSRSSIVHQRSKTRVKLFLSFPEWVEDGTFYEKIVNGEGDAGQIWRSYRSKMESEFAKPNLKVCAEHLADGWGAVR